MMTGRYVGYRRCRRRRQFHTHTHVPYICECVKNCSLENKLFLFKFLQTLPSASVYTKKIIIC